ncbi:MAG: GNAT family N-acetyltransferase [Phycisphaerae bacterium]|nr:GNAT family N-acetyltransferase [Phycisphaerae bacterium]
MGNFGPGRTAMMVCAEPSSPDTEAEAAEVVRAVCADLKSQLIGPAGLSGQILAQVLLDVEPSSLSRVFGVAGFSRLANLAYLRRSLPVRVTRPAGFKIGTSLGPGIDAITLAELGARGGAGPSADAIAAEAMERSYEATLDCPELCGMRRTSDVLALHKSVGEFDPNLWWIIFDRGEASGCMFLNRCAGMRAVELVYLGLAPALRGRGLARKLLEAGVEALAGGREVTLACAVDTRNTPARRLYESVGFRGYATRAAYIRTISAGSGLA